MRRGRELGAAQSQGLLAAALRAMLNLRLATIVHGSLETLGLPPLWGGGVRRTSRHVSFAARHGEVATGWRLCHLSAKVMVAPGTVPEVGLMVVSVSPPHHRDRRQSLQSSQPDNGLRRLLWARCCRPGWAQSRQLVVCVWPPPPDDSCLRGSRPTSAFSRSLFLGWLRCSELLSM